MCLPLGNLRHGLLILVFFGRIVELGIAQRQRYRVMPHQFFEDFKRHPGIEEMGRKGMTQTVRRIMARQTGGREVLIHQPVDVRPEEMRSMPFRTRKEIQTGRGVGAPDLKGLLHIRGQIHDAIDLPFPAVDAYRARAQINGVPGQCTHLRDTQPTAQHEEENESVPDGVNDLKEGGQIRVWQRFGQDRGRQESMPAPEDRLLRHLAFFAEILKETRQQTDFGINGRGGKPRRLGGRDERGDVVGGRLREVLGEHAVALPRQLAAQGVERAHHRGTGRGRRVPRGKQGEVLEDTLLIFQ